MTPFIRAGRGCSSSRQMIKGGPLLNRAVARRLLGQHPTSPSLMAYDDANLNVDVLGFFLPRSHMLLCTPSSIPKRLVTS